MTDLELRERLARYVTGSVTLRALEDWLTTETWDDEALQPSTRQLAYDAIRLISEQQNGDWTEDELKRKLGAMGRTYWLEQAPKTAVHSSSAAASPVVMRSVGRAVPAGTAREVVFG
jgi:hypothetical protein